MNELKHSQEFGPLILQQIKDGKLTNRVYKYRTFDDYSESLFIDHYLYFSKPNAFNDPFDCKIYDGNDYPPKLISNWLKAQGAPVLHPDFISKLPSLMPQFITTSVNNRLDESGVLSLSECEKSILMWSHYSGNHSGFVMGFDIDKDLDFFCIPSRVEYLKDYPSVSYLNNPREAIKTGLTTKFKSWEYEQEVRVIKHKGAGRHTFKKDCLREVIFGCKTDSANRSKIENILGQKGYEHVKIRTATMSQSKYELLIP